MCRPRFLWNLGCLKSQKNASSSRLSSTARCHSRFEIPKNSSKQPFSTFSIANVGHFKAQLCVKMANYIVIIDAMALKKVYGAMKIHFHEKIEIFEIFRRFSIFRVKKHKKMGKNFHLGTFRTLANISGEHLKVVYSTKCDFSTSQRWFLKILQKHTKYVIFARY